MTPSVSYSFLRKEDGNETYLLRIISRLGGFLTNFSSIPSQNTVDIFSILLNAKTNTAKKKRKEKTHISRAGIRFD